MWHAQCLQSTSCLSLDWLYSSTLKMVLDFSSETLLNFYKSRWRHVPEDSYSSQNLKCNLTWSSLLFLLMSHSFTCCYSLYYVSLRLLYFYCISSFLVVFICLLPLIRDMRWRSLLRNYATSRKVVGSFPDEVIGFFNLPNPSSRTMALGPTQSLTEMSTRNLPGSKGPPARKADHLTAICKPIV
jgi:hypothetical protein